MHVRPFLLRAVLAAGAIALATWLHLPADAARPALADGDASTAGLPDEDAELTPEERAALDRYVERFHEAQRLMGGGKDAEAVAILEELVAERPGVAEVHHLLAVVRTFQKRPAEASRAYLTAAKLAPTDPIILRDAGLDQLRHGDVRRAVALLGRSATLHAADVETQVGLGNALRRLGRPDDAATAYRTALAAEPGSVDARVGLVSCIHAEEPEECLELLEGLPETFSDVCLAKAHALISAGRRGEGLAYATRAVERAVPGPGGIPFLRGAARLLLEQGDWEPAAAAAAEWAERDRQGDGPSMGAAFALSQARAASGDADAALAALTSAAPPADAPAMDQLDLYRAALLVAQGDAEAGAKLLALVADSPAEGFARDAARVALARDGSETALDGYTEPRWRNDVAFVHFLAARLRGDDGAAGEHLSAARAASSPPGEFPGALLPLF